jgi:gamma-glutamyltranspeptidase/glutathione hydrolase
MSRPPASRARSLGARLLLATSLLALLLQGCVAGPAPAAAPATPAAQGAPVVTYDAASAPPAANAQGSIVRGRNGVVTSRSLIASQVGLDVMRQDGNAIDAAVATGFALAVTYPSAGNLGGGGFMVIRLADGTVVANDHREVAPAAATRDMYLDADGKPVPGRSTRTHLAVGVPGTVDGLLEVLARHGRLTRQQVLAPAIRLAREGFPLTADLAGQFNEEREKMKALPQSLAIFAKADGTPWRAGEVWRQPELAATLQRISDHGRDGFYAGPVAEGIVAEMRRGQGLITLADLAAYRSKFRAPIRGTYRGAEVWTMPPPSSGGTLLVQMLNMLEAHDVAALGQGTPALVHLMIEAERRAYADRAEHLGDPDFHPVPVARLTDKAYARERMADFDAARATPSSAITAGRIPYESPDTTHASIVDGEGNAVAYTTTLNLSFGSKIVAEGTGVLLNNEMDDFSSKPDTPNSFGLLGRVANEIAPGKRMLSSMTPTIVTRDGRLELVTGTPGGSTIITTVLQVLLNSLDHRMDIGRAVAAPRFHHQWQPDRVLYEPAAFDEGMLAALRAMGHDVVLLPFAGGIGDANSVRVVDGELQATHDPRNDGGAVAY